MTKDIFVICRSISLVSTFRKLTYATYFYFPRIIQQVPQVQQETDYRSEILFKSLKGISNIFLMLIVFSIYSELQAHDFGQAYTYIMWRG